MPRRSLVAVDLDGIGHCGVLCGGLVDARQKN